MKGRDLLKAMVRAHIARGRTGVYNVRSHHRRDLPGGRPIPQTFLPEAEAQAYAHAYFKGVDIIPEDPGISQLLMFGDKTVQEAIDEEPEVAGILANRMPGWNVSATEYYNLPVPEMVNLILDAEREQRVGSTVRDEWLPEEEEEDVDVYERELALLRALESDIRKAITHVKAHTKRTKTKVAQVKAHARTIAGGGKAEQIVPGFSGAIVGETPEKGWDVALPGSKERKTFRTAVEAGKWAADQGHAVKFSFGTQMGGRIAHAAETELANASAKTSATPEGVHEEPAGYGQAAAKAGNFFSIEIGRGAGGKAKAGTPRAMLADQEDIFRLRKIIESKYHEYYGDKKEWTDKTLMQVLEYVGAAFSSGEETDAYELDLGGTPTVFMPTKGKIPMERVIAAAAKGGIEKETEKALRFTLGNRHVSMGAAAHMKQDPDDGKTIKGIVSRKDVQQ